MATLDIFNNDAFSLSNLTAAINKMPYVPGQVGALGLFDSASISTTTAMIEERNGSLSLVADSPRGGPGESVTNDLRQMRVIQVAHFQRDDAINADEVQNIRAFGMESEFEPIEALVQSKLARHARDLDMTIEHLRVGAIKGIVASKNNTLVDCYQLFGQTAPADVSVKLSDPATALRVLFKDLQIGIEDQLEATSYTGMHAFCGNGFYKALLDHKSVKDTYFNYPGAETLRNQMQDRAELFGITWERYRTGAKAAAANGGVAFIADNEARIVIKGVPELFLERYAPADYMDTVNTLGYPRYAYQYEAQNKKQRHLEVQSNPIAICTQPQTLRRLVMA